MSRATILAALAFAALPAIAQAQTAPPPLAPATPSAPTPASPPPVEMTGVQQAAIAFGQCLQTGARTLPAAVTPEVGATSVLNSCATQRQQLEQAAQALIATIPEAERAGAQAQLRSQLGGVEAELASGIRQMRAAPAAGPARPPAPAW